MKIGILGSGTVGQTLGRGLLALGHEVRIGTRDAKNPKVTDWVAASGPKASSGTFADAAGFGEVIFLCTLWAGTENALRMAGSEHFSGKVVVDVTNPLETVEGYGPRLAIGHTTSAGEKVQEWLPVSRVVKAFNTITAAFMIDGRFGSEKLDMFIAGNDAVAKKVVAGFLTHFHWNTHDLGGIEESRILEYFAMLWIRYGVINNVWNHAFKMVRK
jgi:predicted dinucleotide-binding enzyme